MIETPKTLEDLVAMLNEQNVDNKISKFVLEHESNELTSFGLEIKGTTRLKLTVTLLENNGEEDEQ